MLWECFAVICVLSGTAMADNLSYYPCPGFIETAVLPDSISSSQCSSTPASSTSSNNVCKMFFPNTLILNFSFDVTNFINFTVVVTANNVNSMSDSPVTLDASITCSGLVSSTDPETCIVQADTSPLFTGRRGFCFSFISKRFTFPILCRS